MLTPDDIRAEMMDMIRDLCIWECDDATLLYIQGAYDLADSLIKRMEGKLPICRMGARYGTENSFLQNNG